LSRIQNLDQLNLQVLWLNDNKLTRIEGFNHMSRLVELNLAQNFITSIGESLKNLDNLEYLNLASNLLDNFQVNYSYNLCL
jgi:Leucine-rich repeat (LRR) protein